MADSKRPVPKPTPLDSLPPPELPPHLKPAPPGPLRVTQVAITGAPELAVIYKRTYAFAPDRPCQLADEQIPLDADGAFHEEIAPGIAPSFKSLPEDIGFKTGTDLVVQGSARPPRPVNEMTVSVEVGRHHHSAQVIGARFCDYLNGKPAFTPPEPFEEMPLRYENAYGGRDLKCEQALLDEVRRITPPEDLRRSAAVAEGMLKANHPLIYPRNRFGKGYVLEDRQEFIEARELPNLERPDDRLTPERLVVGNPLLWTRQPMPVGFDYLDPLSFPRSAMLGWPPPVQGGIDEVPEIARGLIPPDSFRGNIFAGPPEKMAGLIHPSASRCASLGLWMPSLGGDEVIVLVGMNPAFPELHVRLPLERPVFTLSSAQSPTEIPGTLSTVLIDVDQQLVNLIWVGRTPLAESLPLRQGPEIAATVRVDLRRLSP
jgi:hypothetical protein